MAFRRRRIPLRGPWALLIGVVLLGIGFYQFLTSGALVEHGIVTEATVVDKDSRSRKMRTRYALTVEYRDLVGVKHRGRTEYRGSYGRYDRGQKVDVRYNPDRPSEFALDTFQGLWFGPITFCGIGLLACAAFLFAPQRG